MSDLDRNPGLDPDRFRRAIGHFATGVTIVTTNVEGYLHGMTANAVTSLSLDPLLLLVCVSRDAHTHNELSRRGRFGINILSADQKEVSELFAERSEPEKDRLRGARYHWGGCGVPLIDGCIAYVECEVADQLPGGDHSIFVGRVLSAVVAREDSPLIYYQGRFQGC